MSRLWFVVRILAGLGILAALGSRLGAQPFLDGLRAIEVRSVLVALGIGLLTTVCSAWRWCLVARGLGLRLRLADAVADCYRALLLNSVLPGGVLGDVHRAVRHGRAEFDVGRAVRAVVLERFAGLVVLLAVAAWVLWGLAAAGALLLAVSAGCVTGCARRSGPVLGDIRAGLLAPRRWPWLLVLSGIALAGYLALFVVAARAAGSVATLGELLPVLVLALLAMTLPITVGGWGPREAVTAVGFGAVGLGAAQGLTAAVVYGALSLIGCLPGLGVLLLRHGGPVAAPAPRPTAPPTPAVQH